MSTATPVITIKDANDLVNLTWFSRTAGLDRMTIVNWSKQGKCPAFVRLGPRTTLFSKSEVLAWLESRGISCEG